MVLISDIVFQKWLTDTDRSCLFGKKPDRIPTDRIESTNLTEICLTLYLQLFCIEIQLNENFGQISVFFWLDVYIKGLKKA